MKDNERIFIDTNILIYAYSETEIEKRNVCRNLIACGNTVISTQILQEFANTLLRKFHSPLPMVESAVNIHINTAGYLHINCATTVLQALTLANRYGYSFYDSLVLSAALESECHCLYSEDMQHEQIIEGKLRIVNPFKK